MLLHSAVPLDLPGQSVATIIGVAILAAGLALDLAGVAAVIIHRTTIIPHRPVATLITSGIYRYSRNPMYTGLAGMVAGGALLAGTWWPLLLLPLAVLSVTLLAIKPEEAYLTEHFGSKYTDYQRKARRWL
jgi:protein-S-isoprenylcysteine O-methyltransferase Ste14